MERKLIIALALLILILIPTEAVLPALAAALPALGMFGLGSLMGNSMNMSPDPFMGQGFGSPMSPDPFMGQGFGSPMGPMPAMPMYPPPYPMPGGPEPFPMPGGPEPFPMPGGQGMGGFPMSQQQFYPQMNNNNGWM